MAAAFSPSRALAGLIAAQRDRWALWLAPAMIAGAAWWLVVPVDPPVWLGAAIMAGAIIAAIGLIAWPSPRHDSFLARSRQVMAALCAVVAVAALGAVAAQIRTATVAQAPYAGGSDPAHVQGWVTDIDSSDSGPRLRVLVHGIDGVSAPPQACSDAQCVQPLPHGSLLLVREQGAYAAPCRPVAIVVSKLPAPADYASRCRPLALITGSALALQGGAVIYAAADRLRIVRAQPSAVRRSWTPRAPPDNDQE